MAKLKDIVEKVRSKNAGPFWLTIDIFCGSHEAYQLAVSKLANTQIAEILAIDEATLKRFDIPSLNVIKISLPRPSVQGSLEDRDMHGASWAALISEMDI